MDTEASLNCEASEDGQQTSTSRMTVEQVLQEPWIQLVHWLGVDGEGRPYLLLNIGKGVRILTSRDQQSRITDAIAVQAQRGLDQVYGEESGRMNVVISLEGCGLRNRPPTELVKEILSMLGAKFEGRAGNIYLVNVPAIAAAAINLIRAFLSPTVKAKMRVLAAPAQTALYASLQELSIPLPVGLSIEPVCQQEGSHETSLPIQATTVQVHQKIWFLMFCVFQNLGGCLNLPIPFMWKLVSFLTSYLQTVMHVLLRSSSLVELKAEQGLSKAVSLRAERAERD
ncbi:hypothetical protein CYMTET_13442 [Cymbomonas tetramitiformis]|uniref:CRAL-TRIO domain-containing protein n=1 Tax=Cymbomonas tetramitiformis TaxID=36881 RepID=A0AAE0GID4_9CHLO|nr:hypothetical protein CYMTET_13442 [Cymbomonas tetramitiformis]